MKKAAWICLLITVSILGVVSCATPSASDGDPFWSNHVTITTDPATGCQYVVTGTNQGGITPRLSKAGVPICGGVGK